MKIGRVDPGLLVFLGGLTWAPYVPTPAADVVIDGEGVRLRFVRIPLERDASPAILRDPGKSPVEMIAALAWLAEAWTVAHGGDVGTYPTGIRGQIVNTLDMRTAADWLYKVNLIAALADPAAGL